MTQGLKAYDRWLERLGSERQRDKRVAGRVEGRVEGRAEGRVQGRADMLCRQAKRRFGGAAGELLGNLFGMSPDAGQVAVAEKAVLDSFSEEELLRRVREVRRPETGLGGRITDEQNREATTMAPELTDYECWLDGFGIDQRHQGRFEGHAKGYDEGLAHGRLEGLVKARAEGRVEVLAGQASYRFGKEAGEWLTDLLGTPPDAERLSVAETAVLECSTAEELRRQVRGAS